MPGNPFALTPEIEANPLLSDSWCRSQRYGLDPATDDFPRLHASELADRLARHSRLQTLAQPVVNELSRKVNALQSVVVLSDASGLVLQTFGDTHAMQKAQRFALAPGNLWSESGRGTNAIGTALAIDDSCEIDGRQHFLTSNQGLYCAAVPLQSPDGKIAGVLDISGPARYPHDRTLAWVKGAAKQIEYLWVKQSLHPQQWLMSLHPQLEKLDGVDECLLVFTDNVLMAANRLAMREFSLNADRFGHLTFQQLFPQLRQTAVSVPLPLVAGDRNYYYRLRAPVTAGVAVTARPTLELPFSSQREGEKLLRLLNAGIGLCIEGETGCGKEYVSRTLHRHSRWSGGKFVAINCAALPESLIESELFGYQPGAFTGANKNGYIGKIREADGGVLFLDEIGDMPLTLQTRLLRILQEKEVTPLGASQSSPVNFAVICATHRNLAQLVAEGTFREDLLYRINTIHIDLPPLRQRREDILLLARTFLVRYAGKYRKPIRDFDAAAQHELVAHAWAGNIRELQHPVEKAVILCDGTEISPATLLLRPVATGPSPAAFTTFEEMERAMIEQAMERHGGNLSAVAQQLGVTRQTLYNKIKRYGL